MAVVSGHDVMWAGLSALVGPPRTDLLPHRSAAAVATDVADVVDVVLYDVGGLAGGDGSDLLRLLRLAAPRVLVVTRDLRLDLTDRARELGAEHFVSSHAPAAELRARVDSVLAAEPGTTTPPPPIGTTALLSQREREVLVRIAAGLSNQEICEELFVSINSVKTYIRAAYRKIGVTSRAQAVAWCLSRGLV